MLKLRKKCLKCFAINFKHVRMKNKNIHRGIQVTKLPLHVGLADFRRYVDPYLSRGRRGPKPKISRFKIFNYILYVLHTGLQWNQLKTSRNELHWSNVYKWHLKWSKDGSYQNLFETSVKILLEKNKLDLSILHGDGSNTAAKKGAMGLAIQDISIKKA